MIAQGDPDLTTYLNELPTTNKPESQNNTFWFPTPENLQKTEDYTTKQSRTFKYLIELNEKEKLNPQESTYLKTKSSKRFDWNETLLPEAGKKAIEDIMADYHDEMNIGMNTEFKVKLTAKDDKAVYSRKLRICTEEAQRKITFSCRSQEYQQFN